MSLSAAHSIASDLENAIAAEVGKGVEVDTHIEPAEPEAESQAADLDLARRIEAALAAAAAEGPLREVHDVRVSQSPSGLYVLFHCRVDPTTTVEAVHEAVDALERSLRQAFPEVRRAVGHAEPAREAAG
jgi:divalent metal cation (Fe/Co/Zn/Cd) transporter